MQYVFDGSLPGLLCCIFEVFEMKEAAISVIEQSQHQISVFEPYRIIDTDFTRAKRVWDGLEKKADRTTQSLFYKAYLSEDATTFQHLFNFAKYLFENKTKVYSNFGNNDILAVHQMARKVSREKHRMEAFIRFKKDANGLFMAVVKPDFNVLPLIQTHFKNRYADQPWLIFDEKRKYGIFYDTHTVTEVNFVPSISEENLQLPQINLMDEHEALYDLLWKDYFKSTNITERKNTKLHLQHVPKRYWRYLNEKL